jgi:hypothetical protein
MCSRAYTAGDQRPGTNDEVTCLVCQRQITVRAEDQFRRDELADEREQRRVDQLRLLAEHHQAAANRSPVMNFLSDLKDRGWLGAAVVIGLIGWAVADSRQNDNTPSRPNQFSPSVDLDCADFSSQADAQQYYMAQVGDPDGLDRDADGVACEALP